MYVSSDQAQSAPPTTHLYFELVYVFIISYAEQFVSLLELLILQNILEILKSNEEDLSQSLGQIAESAQHIVNTMVKVLKDAISKNPDSDADASRVRLPIVLFGTNNRIKSRYLNIFKSNDA